MMTSSIVKYSVERFFLVKTFWLKKKFPNQLQMIQKVKKNGRRSNSVRRTNRTDRAAKPATVFFTFWIIWSYKNWKKRSPVKFGPPDGPAGRPIGKTGDLFSHFGSLRVDLEKEFFNQNFWPKNFKINRMMTSSIAKYSV